MKRDYKKISPTMDGPARGRAMTDIPFAKEILAQSDAQQNQETRTYIKTYGEQGLIDLAPFFEARYFITNKLLMEEKPHQVLELAAGLSPRGMEFTKDKNIKYVELDLDTENKIKIVKNILGKVPDNFYFESGNAMDADDVERAVKHFDENKKVFIINEGLLRYINLDEKKQMALVIKKVLSRFGGAWITPDIGLKGRRHGYNQVRDNRIKEMVGVKDFEANYFDDEKYAQEFFEKLGFLVEMHDYSEVKNQLVSPARLKTEPKRLEDVLNWQKVFVMRLK